MWSSEEFECVAGQQVPAPTVVFAPVSLSCDLHETYEHGSRWYRFNGVDYPSITTLISETDTEGKQALKEWRRRIGHEESAAVTQRAAQHGTRWHNFCEAYLTGRPYWQFLTDPKDTAVAATLTTLLNARIRTILVSESRVVSTTLGVAGRMDICAELTDGRLAILDFKTGKKPKTGNRLTNYGLQAAFYATALTEHLNRGILQDIVIVQICPQVIVWQESLASRFLPLLEDRIAQFAAQVNARVT